MLNLLKMLAPKVAATLVVASTLFAQDSNNSNGNSCAPKCKPACAPKPCPKPCPKPKPPTQVCPGQDPCCPSWSTPVLNAGYGYPARTLTRCPWNVNFDVSFIYWQPIQDNMELAVADTQPSDSDKTSGTMVNLDFDYKPGFKIGMGGYFDHDGWDMQFEYTWFHNSQSTKASAPTNGSLFKTLGFPSSIPFATATESWHLDMDIAELDLGRWYYVGTELTFRPNFGLRAAWIGQHVNARYTTDSAGFVDVKQKTNSWAVGAKAGLNTNWAITSGFRLFGNAEADLLFTKYTNLFTRSAQIVIKQKKVYAVKPHVDLELGMGWGTYIDCNSWYLDFVLGYGFQIFFDQNMFRHQTNTSVGNNNMSNGNLYVQGLTFTTKLDF